MQLGRALVVFLCCLPLSGFGATVAKPPAPAAPLPVPRFLVLGPAPLPLPLFHDEPKGGFGLAEAVTTPLLPLDWDRVAPGAMVPWLGGPPLAWREASVAGNGRVVLGVKPTTPLLAYLVATVQTDRFVHAEVELEGTGLARLLVDGKEIVARTGAKDGAGREGKLALTPGTHLLVVQAATEAGQGEWSTGVRLRTRWPESLGFSLPPARQLDLLDVLDRPDVTSVAVSADGTLAALSLRRVIAGTDDAESWVEVRATGDGSLVRTLRGGWEATDVAFVPGRRALAWLAKDRTKAKDVELTSLWLADLESGEVQPVLERVEGLKRFRFAPTGDAVVYATIAKAAADSRGVKVLEGLLDRQKGYRDKEFLWLARLPDGPRLRLTAGSLTTRAVAFSPDGSRLLVRREVEDLSARPYSRHELWEVELATLAGRKVRDFGWLEDVSYAPDGRLLVVAGPSAFGEVGRNLPAEAVANEGDGQLYLFDPRSGQVECLTRDFDPAVMEAVWPRGQRSLLLRAEVGDRQRLFRLDPAAGTIRELDAGGDVVSDWAVAEDAPVVVAAGSGPWRPRAVWVLRGDGDVGTVLTDPAAPWWGNVQQGSVEDWLCTTAAGQPIPGRVYLPPGFDPARSYPAIVYYYAGTSPVTRDFGGRYPKEWWAARGYVVYVPQPSGCTGYGQEHSARHVNEWGKLVVDEIIEATRAFLTAHRYVDPHRVGCIGASYGGFTTMLLLTRTDMFAAAVAHAGISSISSYWGEGYWGYAYNALSAAGSFPWNARDLYVDRSALFAADRVKTPLLLTHGTADTNVPVGESDSFYTALKLVGAPVEYLQVEGEDHWILDHAKRVVWSQAIVAWFDRHLKGQPEWWAELTAPPKPKAGDGEPHGAR